MAQLLKVYSDNAPPPEIEPFIARIVIPEDGTNLRVIWTEPTTGAGRRIVIDWGDGTTEEINTFPSLENTHNYAEAGEYFIKIWVYGDILYGPGASLTVFRYAVECVQWGSGRVRSFRFDGCDGLVTVPNFLPDYVRSCRGMFYACRYFNQPLNDWDVSNVTDFGFTFYECNQYKQPLDKWNVSNGTDFGAMFFKAISFNQPLNDWDVSNGTDFSSMFSGCDTFNQPLDKWNVSRGTYFNGMFYTCGEFNQPLNEWDVSNGTNFSYMFNRSPKFNQPLDKWNVSNGTNFNYMFYRTTLFSQDLSRWCVTKVSTAPTDFSHLSALTPEQLPKWGTCPGNP